MITRRGHHSQGLGAAAESVSRRVPAWFFLAELVLLVAVPALVWFGVQELLHSNAGTFTEAPERNEPGWRALVDPSPVTAIAEMYGDQLSGIVVIAQPGLDGGGGTAIMISPEMLVGESSIRLGDLPVDAALDALSHELRLSFTSRVIVDDVLWQATLGPQSYELSNPDPIPAAHGRPSMPVGRITLSGGDVDRYLGAINPDADPRSLLFRRQLFWSALLDDPPLGEGEFAALLATVGGGQYQVQLLPVRSSDRGLMPQQPLADDAINAAVPLPRGAVPGDRLVMRIVDRTGTADLEALAVDMGHRGFEITEVANASAFDDGPSQLVIPLGLDDPRLRDLAAEFGAVTVSPDPIEEPEADTVVLIVGRDLAGS